MGYEDASSASSDVTLHTGEEGNQAVQLDQMEGGGVKGNNAMGNDGHSTKRRRMSNGIGERKIDKRREIPVAVVEQRVSNLAQGCLCKFQYILVPRRKLTIDRPYSHDQAIRTRFGSYPQRRLSWPIRKCSFAEIPGPTENVLVVYGVGRSSFLRSHC